MYNVLLYKEQSKFLLHIYFKGADSLSRINQQLKDLFVPNPVVAWASSDLFTFRRNFNVLPITWSPKWLLHSCGLTLLLQDAFLTLAPRHFFSKVHALCSSPQKTSPFNMSDKVQRQNRRQF